VIDRAQLAVEQWQQQRPDLDTLPMRLIGRLGEAVQVLNRDVLQPFFDEHRLHYGEFDVLATLRRAGAPHAPTEAGFTLIDGLMTAHVENEKTALATLSRDEQEQLDRLLGKWLAGR
jgi:hypothetical protein